MGRLGFFPNRLVPQEQERRKLRRPVEAEPDQVEMDELFARQLQEREFRSGESVVVAEMQSEVFAAATVDKSEEGIISSSAATSRRAKSKVEEVCLMEESFQTGGEYSCSLLGTDSATVGDSSKDKAASSSKNKSGGKAAVAHGRECLTRQQAAAASTPAAVVAVQKLPVKGQQEAAMNVRQSEVLVGATAAAAQGRVLSQTQQQAAAASSTGSSNGARQQVQNSSGQSSGGNEIFQTRAQTTSHSKATASSLSGSDGSQDYLELSELGGLREKVSSSKAARGRKKSGGKAAAAQGRDCFVITQQQVAAASTPAVVAVQKQPVKGQQEAAMNVRQSEVLVGVTAVAAQGRVLAQTQQQAAAASSTSSSKGGGGKFSMHHRQAAQNERQSEVLAATVGKSEERITFSSAATSRQVKFAGEGDMEESISQTRGEYSPLLTKDGTTVGDSGKDKAASSSKKREGIDRRRRRKRHLATLAKAEMRATSQVGPQPNMQAVIIRAESVPELTTGGSGRIWSKKTNRKNTRESKDSCATGQAEFVIHTPWEIFLSHSC